MSLCKPFYFQQIAFYFVFSSAFLLLCAALFHTSFCGSFPANVVLTETVDHLMCSSTLFACCCCCCATASPPACPVEGAVNPLLVRSTSSFLIIWGKRLHNQVLIYFKMPLLAPAGFFFQMFSQDLSKASCIRIDFFGSCCSSASCVVLIPTDSCCLDLLFVWILQS